MSKQNFVLFFIVGFVVFVFLLSFAGCEKWKTLYPKDNFIEETIEQHLEKTLESAFSLPDGSLKDKIDLSPESEGGLGECMRKCCECSRKKDDIDVKETKDQ